MKWLAALVIALVASVRADNCFVFENALAEADGDPPVYSVGEELQLSWTSDAFFCDDVNSCVPPPPRPLAARHTAPPRHSAKARARARP